MISSHSAQQHIQDVREAAQARPTQQHTIRPVNQHSTQQAAQHTTTRATQHTIRHTTTQATQHTIQHSLPDTAFESSNTTNTDNAADTGDAANDATSAATHALAMAKREAFAKSIRHFRTQQHISQEQLALLAGIDRSYMGRIERSERSISLDKIGALCEALHISEFELFQHFAIELEQAKQQF